jgi:hypothetical protein
MEHLRKYKIPNKVKIPKRKSDKGGHSPLLFYQNDDGCDEIIRRLLIMGALALRVALYQ